MLFSGTLIVLFLFVFRPQEFVPGIIGTRVLLYATSTVFFVWLLSQTKKDLFKTPLDGYVWLFTTWCAVSTLSSAWITYTLITTIDQATMLILYFLLVTTVNSATRFAVTLWFVVGCLFGQAAMGVLQAQGLDLTGLGMVWAPDKDVWQIRGAGIFDNPNDLAYSVVLIVPFCLGALGGRSAVTTRVLALIVLLTTVGCIYLTHSRGGLLALVVAIVLWFVAWVKNRMWRRVAIVVCAAVVVIALAAQTEGYRDDASAMGRVEAWAAGMEMLTAHPFSGVGKGQFIEHHERDSHSSYVRVGAETGLLGLFLFSGMLLSALVVLNQSRSALDDDTSRLYGAGFVGCLGAYLLASIFSSRGYDNVFLVMLALLGAWARLKMAEAGEPPVKVPTLRVLTATCAILLTWKVFLVQAW